ncbi:MAG: hypothetical protein J6B16_01485 [Clostridia bacterium]|nr:hypothetical protein [Clostridia bacterium]
MTKRSISSVNQSEPTTTRFYALKIKAYKLRYPALLFCVLTSITNKVYLI